MTTKSMVLEVIAALLIPMRPLNNKEKTSMLD
jgi:hypothetical protein